MKIGAVRIDRGRVKGITPLHLHWAGIGVLGAVILFLVIRLALVWSGSQDGYQGQIAQEQAQVRASEVRVQPLRGLDVKVVDSDKDAAKFYQKRFPATYSAVAEELGKYAKATGVKLTRNQYTQEKPANGLAEVRMDASLTGDYTALVKFINSLERDRELFFILNSVTLTGQQTGLVSLRLRFTTYLRLNAAGVVGDSPEMVPAVDTTVAPEQGQ